MDPDGDPLFSNGLSVAELAASSNLLQDSWAVISELEPRIDQQHFRLPSPRLEPTTFRSDGSDPVIIKESHFPNYNIIAFVASPVTAGSLQEERDLAPSSEIPDFQFLCSKVNPTFQINRAAVSLFNSLRDKFSRLLEKVLTSAKYKDYLPYVITGHCWGGSIASLFTLRLLNNFDQWRNICPLCITFGSPLLGDSALQQAVSQNSTWDSCFLHVVHKDDSFPRTFLRPPTTDQSPYKPFGTFLLCSDSGGACFEAPESVMKLLMSEIIVRNPEPQNVDYKNAIECLEKGFIYGNCSRLNGQEADSYKAGVTIQVTAVSLEPIQKNEGNDALIEDIVNHERGIIRRKREAFDPVEELRKMTEYLKLLEWYLTICRGNGMGPGYYDRFKNTREGLINNGVEKYKAILTDYWETVVEEADKNHRSSATPLRNRFLFGGTTYRTIVEPLDIAEYYKCGRNDYLNQGRSEHYKLLEQWLKDYRRPFTRVSSPSLKLPHVTEDSCFWAHVEEAIRSCRLLASGGPSHSSGRANLINFEDYVMRLINDRAVSPDIFLEKSSYMQWWREYEEILEKQMMGHSHDSRSQLVRFMREQPWQEFYRHGE
ncbi:senescence-associated carboxylesterase 101-like [Rhodamnia argentea]|uniref:Senescence-associated carboxylesterase 101-like n=1 Tax=Rhodamnia argentea TaxID=178133 RepID=A0A8B8QI05_9MYRT|nr:senescence-associated carboxylesterase 101-like [Rhodamnia argentea]